MDDVTVLMDQPLKKSADIDEVLQRESSNDMKSSVHDGLSTTSPGGESARERKKRRLYDAANLILSK